MIVLQSDTFCKPSTIFDQWNHHNEQLYSQLKVGFSHLEFSEALRLQAQSDFPD